MNKQIAGIKLNMVQKFTPEGKRIVVTRIKAEPEKKLGLMFKAGDSVKVTGRSKGRGFTGVMKRWGFKGGPRTHGQSDRQLAPGSIGQGTDPGRVFPGKKMPGRFGGHQVTISGLSVFEVDEKAQVLSVTGPVPGPRNGWLTVKNVARGFVKKEIKPELKSPEKKEEAEQKEEKTEEKNAEN